MINYPARPVFAIGDVISYSPFGGGERVVVVTDRAEHNGQPAFDGFVVSEPTFTVWGYEHQILKNLGKARFAVVDGQADKIATIQRYLPSNFGAVVDGEHVQIVGFDSAGWTLDDYVIPRLASGMFRATETTGRV